MNHTEEQNTDAVWVSKTQKKKEMDALQDLGVALTKLAPDTLKKIGLPEDLLQAVLAHKKITSNSALKRQTQYIGRLMREIDPAPIEAYLAKLKGENNAHNAYMQRLEMLRERLIDNDDALTDLIGKHPHIDIAALRVLIRNARKEREQQKPPKAFRALFQQLRQEINETDAV
ncbi:ribosome biogenesis factor YjgA [Stenoxybacter acetivorans]|uniref:ribosome biogenesis factor YjgA n=1 Tax=Stenoxybacter acetivorans TaxID=422441 RepID=UPI000569DF63|nr:ribosome biogenesis factor YjgA [Stenoxybacter acetivorans]